MISLPPDSVRKYPPPFHTEGPYAPHVYMDSTATIRDISGLDPAIYLIRIEDSDQVHFRKIVVN